MLRLILIGKCVIPSVPPLSHACKGSREAKSKRVDGTTDDLPVLYGDVPPPILIGGEY